MPSSSSPSRPIKQSKKQKQKQKQRKMKETINNNNDSLFLPQEIINHILTRLPVKSLIRFQCVCKSWKTLIQTPSFIHQHLHHSTIQNPCLLFSHRLCLLNNDMKLVHLHSPTLLRRRPHIIGSVNGLLCLHHYNNLSHPFFLWNPAIRDLKPVPIKPLPVFILDWMGFGYSSIVNHYNIVMIISHVGSGLRILSARVYSLKTWSWKDVEASPLTGIISISHQNFSVNGNIFWVAVMSVDRVLVSYDIALEVFTVIPLPISPVNSLDSYFTRLTIHEDKIAILSHNFIGNPISCLIDISIGNPVSCLIDMWVIEDGINETGERCVWTKKFSASHPSLSIALATWRNKLVYLPRYTHATQGENLGRNSIGLIDLTTSEVNIYDNFIYHMSNPFLNYVESLVPVSKKLD